MDKLKETVEENVDYIGERVDRVEEKFGNEISTLNRRGK